MPVLRIANGSRAFAAGAPNIRELETAFAQGPLSGEQPAPVVGRGKTQVDCMPVPIARLPGCSRGRGMRHRPQPKPSPLFHRVLSGERRAGFTFQVIVRLRGRRSARTRSLSMTFSPLYAKFRTSVAGDIPSLHRSQFPFRLATMSFWFAFGFVLNSAWRSASVSLTQQEPGDTLAGA
jgi:hypothetical protein